MWLGIEAILRIEATTIVAKVLCRYCSKNNFSGFRDFTAAK